MSKKKNKKKYYVVVDSIHRSVRYYDDPHYVKKGQGISTFVFKDDVKALDCLEKWQIKFSVHEEDADYQQFLSELKATRPETATSQKSWVVLDLANKDIQFCANKDDLKKLLKGKGKNCTKFTDDYSAYCYVKECRQKIEDAKESEKKTSPSKCWVVLNKNQKTAILCTTPEERKAATYKVSGAMSRAFKSKRDALAFQKSYEEAFASGEAPEVIIRRHENPSLLGEEIPPKYWVVYNRRTLMIDIYENKKQYLKAIKHKKGLQVRVFNDEDDVSQYIQECQEDVHKNESNEKTGSDDEFNIYEDDHDEDEYTFDSYDEAIDELVEHDDEIENEAMDLAYETGFKRHMIAFVDGSYAGDMYGYGAVMITPDGLHQLSGSGNAPELTELRNVAGELMAVTNVINCAQIRGYTSLTISYDFAGIEKYLDGKNKNPLIQGYAKYVASQREFMDITFCKVKAHSSNFLNDLADQLAKRAAKQANIMKVAID